MTIADTLYFWVDGIIIDYTEQEFFKLEGLNPFKNILCVDGRVDGSEGRYGLWTEYSWKHIPFSDFPTEFKLQLLLLGIS